MIFISADDLISTFWFASRKQFYCISQVSRQWAQLSETFLDRYPQKDVDPLVIKAGAVDGQNEAGLENNQQIGGNRLFIERWKPNEESGREPEEEIPFAPKLHAYPKVGKIRYISIKAPLQNNALEFLQGCCTNHNFNGLRELHFAGFSFDIFAETHGPSEFAAFSAISKNFRIILATLPENLKKFGEFLTISECRNIQIQNMFANHVEPFVEWITHCPLPQHFVKLNGHENPVPDFPSFSFDEFPSNAPKMIAAKCRQIFNGAHKGQHQFADGNAVVEKTPKMPYCNLNFGRVAAANYLPNVERTMFQMRNRRTGDKFYYVKRGGWACLECKPRGRIPLFARRAVDKTKIWVDLEETDDDDKDEEKVEELEDEEKDEEKESSSDSDE